MLILSYFFVFAFGTIIGSFLNVVILRYNTGESIVVGGSKCLACAKKLKWYELVPIFSFVLQKGKCRECFSKISWQYTIIEIITGSLFLLIYNFNFSALGAASAVGQGPASVGQFLILNFAPIIYYWAIFSILIIIAVYDYYHQIIPDLFVYIFIGLSFLGLFGILSADWRIGVWNFAAGIILFSFFGALWFFSRGAWMGFGDVKLALGIGWLLGTEKGILAVMLSFWLGAIVGVSLLLWSKWKSGGKYCMKTRIAFGPFLVLGAIIAFFAGEALVKIFIHNFAL